MPKVIIVLVIIYIFSLYLVFNLGQVENISIADKEEVQLYDAKLKKKINNLNDEIILLKKEITSIKKNKLQAIKNIRQSDKWKHIDNWRQLSHGMSFQQVKKILGQPERTEGVSFQTKWLYGNYSEVVFNNLGTYKEFGSEHRLVSWTEPLEKLENENKDD